MKLIDEIVANALNGRTQRVGVEEALAIGAAVRLAAKILAMEVADREEFARSYGSVAMEGVDALMADK